MERRSIYSGLAIVAVAAAALLVPRPVRAADYMRAERQQLERALTDCQQMGIGDPSFDWVDHEKHVLGPRNLQDGMQKLMEARISALRPGSPAQELEFQGFRTFMCGHFNEAVQAEIRVTIEARLSEAREYLRQGQTELFESTLVALMLPAAPPASDVVGTQRWLRQWQRNLSMIHGHPEQALALMNAISQSFQAPVNP